ncbi:MAG: septum formation protein Maf [Calditrichaeota bacterium]|nr:MAG: septum formation protein Maf [Calditrichota bacterium]
MKKQLVLASTSPFRATLLQRLNVPFVTVAPEINEKEEESESPSEMALRLARQKAEAVVKQFENALIIGSDQVAALGNDVLRKPGSIEKAFEQLQRMRGKEHQLHTAVHVIDSKTGNSESTLNTARLRIREDLTDREIMHYIKLEMPLACAGAYKIEGAGIALFESIQCDDWTAIIGLPLIALSKILRKMDFLETEQT